MAIETLFPDYIFESSWEVCNKVGGIYTVLSSRAKTLQGKLRDKIIFIGPDLKDDKFFKEDKSLLSEWTKLAEADGLKVRIGRWQIPGQPVAVLVDFAPFYDKKNEIYSEAWAESAVDSLHAYGDYDEASMFSYAAAKVVECFYNKCVASGSKVVYHGNEWMTSLGLLYIKHHLPQVATIFTTHATSIGRSIAGNNKLLYKYFEGYSGDQMAGELNMQSKHSVEKQSALGVDCFTTVSDITAKECEQLLDKKPDVVLPNGFDDAFVPTGKTYDKKRADARRKLLSVASKLTGKKFTDDTLIISTSGRYEVRNKGIDVFVDAINRLRQNQSYDKETIAFIMVPAWLKEAREDLQERLKSRKTFTEPLSEPVITHWLYNMNEDRAMNMMRSMNIANSKDDKVNLIFLPCYLNGNDGIFNMSYYDLLLANDVCVYPSYYEPWGYTPLEAVAFHVPCVTTDLAGFGLWAMKQQPKKCGKLADGVKVIHRDDDNYDELANEICNAIIEYASLNAEKRLAARQNALKLSSQAVWQKFIKFYYKAYDKALKKALKRNENKK